MAVGPRMLLKRSLKSKHSRHKNQYDHNNTNHRPVDLCAHVVILSYDQKFKKLDSLFAADVVGNGTSEVVGPFEAAKKRFFKETVIPICAGWFGKVNKDYETLISTLAREAAAGDDGMWICPLVNSNRKGGATKLCSSSSEES